MSSQQIQTLIRNGVPQAEDLDLRIISSDAEYALTCVPFSPRLVRPGGTLSGPTMMALADAAMYALIFASLGQQEMAVTSNLNINFLSRPAPADLYARATWMKRTGRQAVCAVDLFSADNERQLVAHATGTYSLQTTSG
ncbi:MAG: PaaI family thioesterase [Pseudomonadaceae bacterium]